MYHTLGTSESFEGNRVLILDNEEDAWLVTEGTVHIFASKKNIKGSAGRRFYIAEFTRGDILFGTKPYSISEEESIVLICSGVVDAKISKVSGNDLGNMLADAEKAKTVISAINKWLASFAESRLNFDLELLPENHFDGPDILSKLHIGNSKIMEITACYVAGLCREEEFRIKRRRRNDEAFVKASLNELTEVFRKNKANDKARAEVINYRDYPLAAACLLVGSSMGINISIPKKEILDKSKDLLTDVVRNSHIKYRQIILSGEWWKTDNGPFLAFLAESNAPVAVLPVTDRSYIMVNPKDNTEVTVAPGTAMSLKPGAYMFYRALPNKKLSLKDLLGFCAGSSVKKDVLIMLLIGIMGGVLDTFIPIANGILFNRIIPEGERSQLIQMAFILISLGVSGCLFQLVRSFATVRIESKVNVFLQAAIWNRVLSLPIPFFRQFTAGELTMRATGIDQIRKVLSGTMITTALSAVFSVFNLILLFRYSIRLAFYMVLFITLSIVFAFGCGLLQLRYKRKLTAMANSIAGQLLQIIGGISKFRVAGAERRAFLQWAKAFGKQREVEWKAQTIENVLVTFRSVSPVIMSMLLFTAVFYDSGMGTGSFIAFNSAFVIFITAMLTLFDIMPAINSVIPTYEGLKPILNALPEYDEIKENPGELDGSIELSHITFRYKPDLQPVLNDLSLKIKKGEYIAIVGPSGCGKSTILRLLLGFEKAEEGKIYYGGYDIDHVDIRAIRKQLGVVMQDSRLLSGDIRSNILGNNPGLTIEDAVEASKMAGIYEDIEAMPMGMFTVVSEGGSTLSGGQRQRILIARVLAGKPKIIFFDEATSALDNKTQAIVSKSMDSLKATRIVIAHRLSTIINCDRILVVNHGRVIEEGSYQDLMSGKGAFYELARRQLM